MGSGIKRNWNLPDDDTVGSDDPAISETDTFDPDRDEPASNEAVSNTDTPVCTYEEVERSFMNLRMHTITRYSVVCHQVQKSIQRTC